MFDNFSPVTRSFIHVYIYILMILSEFIMDLLEKDHDKFNTCLNGEQ